MSARRTSELELWHGSPSLEDLTAAAFEASIETLAAAVAGPGGFALLVDGQGVTWFMCPSCRHRDHNPPSAVVVDAFRWRCYRCRAAGTRWLLERLVVEDPDRLLRLGELLEADDG